MEVVNYKGKAQQKLGESGEQSCYFVSPHIGVIIQIQKIWGSHGKEQRDKDGNTDVQRMEGLTGANGAEKKAQENVLEEQREQGGEQSQVRLSQG